MAEEINVSIKKLIVHILDNNLHLPVLSDEEHPEDEEIDEFVEKHIIKILKDDSVKKARFTDENSRMKEICESLVLSYADFKPYTDEAAGILFEIMQKHVDIPSADVIFTIFEVDNEPYFGILKFNYKSSYIHYVHTRQTGKVNTIVKQKTALPTEGQRLDECVLISLHSLEISLLEKKYEINGEKDFYLSTLFLKCSGDLSTREKVKIFKKANENFNKQFFNEDFTKSAELKTAVAESFDQNAAIHVVEVAETVFRQNPEMKNTYIDYMEKAGITGGTLEVSETVAERKFKRQKIKTDTGIEINLPVEYYKDSDKMEFINNVDGTISILIKNVSKIVDA